MCVSDTSHFVSLNVFFPPFPQLLTQLKTVNFTQNGYDVSFDANGDPVAKYELVNWQKSVSGSIELVTVGHYDASLPAGQEFRIISNLTWVEGATQVSVPKAINLNLLFSNLVISNGLMFCFALSSSCPPEMIHL